MKRLFLTTILLFLFALRPVSAFRFISWSDAQDGGSTLQKTSNQAVTLNPDFTIFSGDLENDGVNVSGELIPELTGLNGGTINFNAGNGMFKKTFFVRGNHDNHQSGSSNLWQNYFANLARPQPPGITNYVGMDSGSTYLTYSFDFGNSRFIGVDAPGNASTISSTQINFINSRLTDAENKTLNPGLQHAFIYFHGPIYCTADNHCSCPTATDSTCTPAAFISMVNNHKIVSATFHGHEHILGWTHLSSSRLSNLAGRTYEQFMVSPAGASPYNSGLFPDRMDYVDLTSARAFAMVDVNGTSFGVSLYRVGTSVPTCKQIINCSKDLNTGNTSCTNSLCLAVTPTNSPTPTIPAACPKASRGDIDCSGAINAVDLSLQMTKYKTNTAISDFDKTGIVNIIDTAILLANFGK